MQDDGSVKGPRVGVGVRSNVRAGIVVSVVTSVVIGVVVGVVVLGRLCGLVGRLGGLGIRRRDGSVNVGVVVGILISDIAWFLVVGLVARSFGFLLS